MFEMNIMQFLYGQTEVMPSLVSKPLKPEIEEVSALTPLDIENDNIKAKAAMFFWETSSDSLHEFIKYLSKGE